MVKDTPTSFRDAKPDRNANDNKTKNLNDYAYRLSDCGLQ